MSRPLVKTIAAALGLTTICLIWVIEPLVDSHHTSVYHWAGRSTNFFGPVALDILVLWVLTTLVLLSARSRGRWRVAVWSAVVLFTPSIALKSIRLLNIVSLPLMLTLSLLGVAAVLYVVVLLSWRPAFTRWFERVVRLTSTVLGFLAIFSLLLFGQLAWFGWQARSLNDPLPLHHSTAEIKPRIIWIVLDELSYQQLYEHRYQGLKLPAFDALAAQSTVFTHAIPAGVPTDEDVRTEKILPSLLTGKPVDSVTSSASGQLSIHDPDTQSWQLFLQHDTVFQDAVDNGYGTAVVGWYNPYCRIMPSVLDHCYWIFDADMSNYMVHDGSVVRNMGKPLNFIMETSTFRKVFGPIVKISENNYGSAQGHISDYRKLYEAADKALNNPLEGFVLLHLPLPHPGGMYDRRTDQITANGSTYIDNLALADKYLAHVRSTLTQNGQWDSSTIIIMGDHSWRTTMWRGTREWTPEDESASLGGHFDDRPAYIVKLPGQQKHAQIDTPFRAVQTRKLMDELFAQKIRSEDDLTAWVQQNH